LACILCFIKIQILYFFQTISVVFFKVHLLFLTFTRFRDMVRQSNVLSVINIRVLVAEQSRAGYCESDLIYARVRESLLSVILSGGAIMRNDASTVAREGLISRAGAARRSCLQFLAPRVLIQGEISGSEISPPTQFDLHTYQPRDPVGDLKFQSFLASAGQVAEMINASSFSQKSLHDRYQSNS